MKVMPVVIRAEYRGEHRIRVVFADGIDAVVDFSDWLEGPVFAPLKDARYFSRFVIDGGTIAWPNGADIAPETLYDRAKEAEAA